MNEYKEIIPFVKNVIYYSSSFNRKWKATKTVLLPVA
jgi:hypothetical protein